MGRDVLLLPHQPRIVNSAREIPREHCDRKQKIPATTGLTKTCYHRNLYTLPNLAVLNAEALFFLALVRLALMQGSFKPSHGLA